MIPLDEINYKFELNKIRHEMKEAFDKCKKVKTLSEKESELMIYIRDYGIKEGSKKYLVK